MSGRIGLMSKRQAPWDEANERIIKVFNLRLPEPLHEKLKHVAYQDRVSVHEFCLRAVSAAVDKRLKQLGIE